MLKATKQTRQINSFVLVSIPSPRDLFARYGEKQGQGIYASDGLVSGQVLNSGNTVIDQMIAAQSMLESECKSVEPARQ